MRDYIRGIGVDVKRIVSLELAERSFRRINVEIAGIESAYLEYFLNIFKLIL